MAKRKTKRELKLIMEPVNEDWQFKIVLFKDKSGKARFRTEHINGRISMSSEDYSSPGTATRMAKNVARDADWPVYQDVESWYRK